MTTFVFIWIAPARQPSSDELALIDPANAVASLGGQGV